MVFLTVFAIWNHFGGLEKDISEETELEAEFLYRKFVIFPLGDKIILKRKLDKSIQTASIGFNFEEMTFEAKLGDKCLHIRSFNEFLMKGSFLSQRIFNFEYHF